jgi:hypothetical protein
MSINITNLLMIARSLGIPGFSARVYAVTRGFGGVTRCYAPVIRYNLRRSGRFEPPVERGLHDRVGAAAWPIALQASRLPL